jgi:hypothetical protein
MLSKVNERRLSVYKYLYLEKLLFTSTEVIRRHKQATNQRFNFRHFENITKKIVKFRYNWLYKKISKMNKDVKK